MSELRGYTAVWGLKEWPSVYHFALLMLIAHWSERRGFCYASQPALAKKLKISERQIQRVIADLESRGWIEIDRQRQASGHLGHNHIRLTVALTGSTSDTDIEGEDFIGSPPESPMVAQNVPPRRRKGPGLTGGLGDDSQAGQEGEDSNGDKRKGEKASDIAFVNSILSRFNNLAELYGFPVAKMTDARKAAIRARTKEHGAEAWAVLFAEIEGSAFLRGEVKSRNRDPYRLTVNSVIAPEMFAKIIEKTFHGGAQPKRSGGVTDVQAALRADIGLQRGLAQRWKQDNGDWPADAGPAPDQPGCILADSVLYGIGLAPGGLPLSHEPPAGDEEAFLDD